MRLNKKRFHEKIVFELMRSLFVKLSVISRCFKIALARSLKISAYYLKLVCLHCTIGFIVIKHNNLSLTVGFTLQSFMRVPCTVDYYF